ncbi:glycosyltransferase family 4 protein [soil metagenome]
MSTANVASHATAVARRPPIRVLLLCQQLDIAGGVERFVCALANHLAQQGMDAAIGTVDTPRGAIRYHVDKAVRVLAGSAPRGSPSDAAISGPARAWALLRAQWRTGRTLAQLIGRERPDVIVLNGLTTACSVLLLAPGCAPRVICCDHNHFEARSALWQTLRAWLYPKVAALVSLTEADAGRFRALNTNTQVIYNASSLWADSPASATGATVLAVGRCVAQKGFDLLLAAWHTVAARVPSARLRIVGDGPLQASLEQRAAQLGITDRIEWIAPTEHIERHYREAAVFVLPSRYEGMPLVLLEAQALGVPAVAFDCPTGPREIIESGVTGLVVPALDVPALAEALQTLLTQPALRERMAKAAIERSRARFTPQAHVDRWTSLIRDVAARGVRHA